VRLKNAARRVNDSAFLIKAMSFFPSRIYLQRSSQWPPGAIFFVWCFNARSPGNIAAEWNCKRWCLVFYANAGVWCFTDPHANEHFVLSFEKAVFSSERSRSDWLSYNIDFA